MSQEIERKFKVITEKLPDLSLLTPTWISQTYLWKNPEIRVRISKNVHEIVATLTIKNKKFLRRFEKNFNLPVWLGDWLFSFGYDAVMKKRYKLPRHEKYNSFWEVDQFVPEDWFWLAEAELDREIERLDLPEWIGEEVTQDARYYNQNLAKTLKVLRREQKEKEKSLQAAA